MTKKHFKELAERLNMCMPVETTHPCYDEAFNAWITACKAVALACKKFNPRFDMDKFMDACRS